jgi:phospholipid transport system substrate-binding protein
MTPSLGKQPVLCSQYQLLGVLCGMLMSMQVWADGSTGPAEMLATMTDRVLAEIRNNPAILDDEARTRRLAEELILPNIDFRVASQWVLGKHWRTASPSQREAFIGEFRAMLMNTYLRSLDKYHDYTVRILTARPGQPNGRAIVDAEVLQPDGPPIKVLFRLHQRKNAWLVYDIIIEGVSLVATHRSGFATEIRDKGLDSLIAQLVVRNASEATATGTAEH